MSDVPSAPQPAAGGLPADWAGFAWLRPCLRPRLSSPVPRGHLPTAWSPSVCFAWAVASSNEGQRRPIADLGGGQEGDRLPYSHSELHRHYPMGFRPGGRIAPPAPVAALEGTLRQRPPLVRSARFPWLGLGATGIMITPTTMRGHPSSSASPATSPAGTSRSSRICCNA
jgi:hypothetical protein